MPLKEKQKKTKQIHAIEGRDIFLFFISITSSAGTIISVSAGLSSAGFLN